MLKLFSALLLLPFFTSAQKDYSPIFDKYMQGQVNLYEFSGNVLVAQKGKVLYKKAFGLANREWNIQNTIQSKFRIASITKQFTAAAILQLVDIGKLNLEDKLSKYFPDFPQGDSINIHMLLNHTSGIKDYTSLPNFRSLERLSLSKDSIVALFKNQPYDFRPGTQWSYSNSGYFLLGLIIEKVSQQSYDSYLLQNLFIKAGLHNTAVDKTDTILINRAIGYQRIPSGWRNANYQSMEFPYSAGAIFSTIEDMFQWNKALFSEKIISPAMFVKMTTPYVNHYGYGIYIDSLQNKKRIRHNGGISGFLNHSVYFPTEDVYIIVFSNNGSESRGIANTLSAILFGTPIIGPYKHKVVKIDPRVLDKCLGKYITTDITGNTTFELIKKKDKLFRKTGMNEVEIFPESNTKFFFGDKIDSQILFSVDAKGTVVKTEFIRNGFISELKKIQ